MKHHLRLISRLAVVAVATGGLCCATIAFAESTTYAPEPVDRTGTETPTKKTQQTAAEMGEQKPEPGRVGSMAPIGAKPSKAELAKMEAEKAAKAGTKPGETKVAGKTAALDAKDRAFIMEAAQDGMKEVEMGNMAANKAKSADVKKLGKMIAADHAKANKELMALAQAKGVRLARPAKMPAMSDANFDSAYLDQMVKDHQKDIADFERAARNSKDADVKSWASKTLPTLKKHLAEVKKAQGSMKKAL